MTAWSNPRYNSIFYNKKQDKRDIVGLWTYFAFGAGMFDKIREVIILLAF